MAGRAGLALGPRTLRVFGQQVKNLANLFVNTTDDINC